jgi:hypothetical protein
VRAVAVVQLQLHARHARDARAFERGGVVTCVGIIDGCGEWWRWRVCPRGRGPRDDGGFQGF